MTQTTSTHTDRRVGRATHGAAAPHVQRRTVGGASRSVGRVVGGVADVERVVRLLAGVGGVRGVGAVARLRRVVGRVVGHVVGAVRGLGAALHPALHVLAVRVLVEAPLGHEQGGDGARRKADGRRPRRDPAAPAVAARVVHHVQAGHGRPNAICAGKEKKHATLAHAHGTAMTSGADFQLGWGASS